MSNFYLFQREKTAYGCYVEVTHYEKKKTGGGIFSTRRHEQTHAHDGITIHSELCYVMVSHFGFSDVSEQWESGKGVKVAPSPLFTHC